MVTSSINAFLANLAKHNDVAKSERFYVQITPPPGMSSLNYSNDLQYQCEMGEIPGVGLETTKYRFYGIDKNIAVGKLYEEVMLSFICTNDFYEKPFFDSWVDYVSPEAEGWDLNYKNLFVGTIVIFQTDQMNNIIYQATLVNAFPVKVAPLETKWSNDNIHKLNVTFLYDKYTPNQGSLNNITTFFNVA